MGACRFGGVSVLPSGYASGRIDGWLESLASGALRSSSQAVTSTARLEGLRMDFSVVIPLFNKGPHVAAAIGSALEQALSPREVIVVDDGSTDGGPEIVRGMADPRIKLLFRSPPGPGGYAARNHGIEHATGEWIAFLDADDLWLPMHLSDMADAVSACSEPVGGVFTRYEIKQAARDRLGPAATDILMPGLALDLRTVLRAWLKTGRCPIWTSACAFRRELLIDAGLFPAGRTRRGGDKDLWLRAAARARSAFAPRVSAEFHQDTVNRVSTSTAHTELPIIVETISSLLSAASPAERKLLRALSNLEVALYARYAAGRGARVDSRFLRALYLPEGLPEAATISALSFAGPLIGRVRSRVRGPVD